MGAQERTLGRVAAIWERLVAVDLPDEEETRLGRLFNILMVISEIMVLAIIITFLLMWSFDLMTSALFLRALFFSLAFVPVPVFCFIQAKRGRIYRTINFYSLVNLVGIALAILLFEGARFSGWWFLYIWAIIIAGTLLSPRYALGMTGAAVGLFAFLAIISGLGLYEPPFAFGVEGREVGSTAFGLIILIFTVGLLTYLNMQSLRQASGRLRASRHELEEQRQFLEQQMRDRTRALQDANYALQRRAIQLEASAEVSRAIASIFDIDQLLKNTVNLIRDRFGFYHAGIFLLDDAGEWMVLEEATGEAGARMKREGHRRRVGETSMVGWTALHQKPRVALEVGRDEVHSAHPLLPHTRSEMTVPLMSGGRVLGVLDVQSVEEDAFDEDDVRALQSMAGQISVAIENAQQVSEEAALLEATSPIYRVSRRLTTVTSVGEVAEAIITSVDEEGADGCAVILYEFAADGETIQTLYYAGVWRRDREPQFAPGTRLSAEQSMLPLDLAENLLIVPDISQDEQLPPNAREVFAETGVMAVANIPLRIEERGIGQIAVLRTEPGPFSDIAIRLYETLSDQAAVALERARLLEETRRRVEEEVTLRAIGDRLARAVDLETVLRSTAEELAKVLQASGVYFELGAESAPVGAPEAGA